MKIAIASCMLYALANTLAADPLATYEHDSFDTGRGKLTIYFLGHATLMMTWGKLVIHIDPVAEHADYKKLPKADLVLVTHEHHDHLDAKTIAAIGKKGTRIVLNQAGRDQLGDGEALKNGDSMEVHGIGIKAVPAYNTSPGHEKFHPSGGRDNGYVLILGDKRVYIAGDTEDIPEMAELKNIEIAFLPMNQPYTMTPAQVAHAVEMIKPKIVYPYHYGDTDTGELVKLLKDVKGTELRIRKMK
jgi:L-ascorbate metabolism protein UlaG (beta-lactamase superfamily)